MPPGRRSDTIVSPRIGARPRRSRPLTRPAPSMRALPSMRSLSPNSRTMMRRRLLLTPVLAALVLATARCAPAPAPASPTPAASPTASPAAAPAASPAAPALYFPEPGDRWQRRRAADVGMDSAALAAAVAHARASEIGWLRDMAVQVTRNFPNEPYPDIIGPVRDRGEQNGIVLRRGYIVAEWGDTERVDMTFSVAKSYLATVAGLALDDGRIRSLDDSVRGYLRPDLFGADLFDDGRNRGITWRHLLTQT